MLATALILGLTGSLHCAGMCSPLAIAVTGVTTRSFVNRVFYNAGRILMYAILGATISFVGYLLPISNFQNLLSILMGILLLLASIGLFNLNVPALTKPIAQFTQHIRKLFSFLIQKKNFSSLFLLGVLNGLLPCGLLWIALTYCITLTSAANGMLFMIGFGAGTLPVMLGLTGLITLIIKRFNIGLSTVTRSALLITGLLMIARVFIVEMHHQQSMHEGFIDIVLCR
jgi:sulfite exporter TauE/SafE